MCHDEGTDFETALRELLLIAYADGKSIEGTWRLESEPNEVPDWTVTVDRQTVTTRRGILDEIQ